MTTESKTTPTIEVRLEQLRRDAAAIRLALETAERETEGLRKRDEAVSRRISTIERASSELRFLPPVAPDQVSLEHLHTWRKRIAAELLTLPERPSTDLELGKRRNLALSIATIDRGPAVLTGTGYDVTTLRLGQLMREAGYEPVGADPIRHYSGVMPWFGSIEDVEERVTAHNERRAKAQAQLDEALAADAAPQLTAST